MQKKVLIVSAHPEPTSVTQQLVQVTVDALERQGHEVIHSDLYAMRWKAVFDEQDFPLRADPNRLSFIVESAQAYASGNQTADVLEEQEKLRKVDAVILQFRCGGSVSRPSSRAGSNGSTHSVSVTATRTEATRTATARGP